MRALSNAELLDVWEAGQTQGPVERALSLLVSAMPGHPAEELAQLPVGERDQRLMVLRAATFGRDLPMLATCLQCGERLEWSARVDDLLVPSAIPAGTNTQGAVDTGEYHVGFRLPNSIDLAAVGGLEPEAAAEALLLRCVFEVTRGTEAIDARAIPGEVADAVAARMAELDPQADLDMALTCPACSYAWSAPFDIGNYLWSEVQAHALRILTEVHLLARAYSWSEREILAMSPRRRRVYLELLG